MNDRGEVGLGGAGRPAQRGVAVCKSIRRCSRCEEGGGRGRDQQAVMAVNQDGIFHSRFSLLPPTGCALLSSSRFRSVCYVVCVCVKQNRKEVGGVLLRSPGSLPTAPWGKKKQPARRSPVTTNALLTPVCTKDTNPPTST